MAATQYIGARYVPVFADPAEWNNTRTYEPLTIVQHEGNSYTSKQYVPKGVDILDEDFWANTGNYNAQVEQYRQEVKTYDGRITANVNAISNETTRAKAAESTLQKNIDSEATRAKGAESTLQSTLQKNIDSETTRAKGVEASIKKSISISECDAIFIGDSWTAGYTQNTGDGFVKVISNMGIFKSCKNYGVGGAGYQYNASAPDKTLFTKIVDKVIAENDTAEYIFVMGGVNDLWLSSSTEYSSAYETLKKLKTAYPNARIMVSANVLQNMQFDVQTLVNAPLRAAEKLGLIPFYGLAEHLLYRNWWTEDAYHVTGTAHKYIADMLLAKMRGLPFPRRADFASIKDKLTDVADNVTISYGTFNTINVNGEHVSISINATISKPTQNQALFTIPQSLRPIVSNVYKQDQSAYPNSNYNLVNSWYQGLQFSHCYNLNLATGVVKWIAPDYGYTLSDNISISWSFDGSIDNAVWYQSFSPMSIA